MADPYNPVKGLMLGGESTTEGARAYPGGANMHLSVPELEKMIKDKGYTLNYVPYAESSLTPGFLGQIRGVTDLNGKTVKIGQKANPTEAHMREILSHELQHIDDPHWDCGMGKCFTFGKPKKD